MNKFDLFLNKIVNNKTYRYIGYVIFAVGGYYLGAIVAQAVNK